MTRLVPEDGLPHSRAMRIYVLAALLLTPAVASAQAIEPGRWNVVSTAVDLVVPGAPGFLLRMMKGRAKTERKCVSPALAQTGIAALLAPDPKAQCRVDTLDVGGGRYAQTLTCPQKSGGPMHITRSGTYDAAGFAGRLKMTGQTPKGALAITIDQSARRVAGSCPG